MDKYNQSSVSSLYIQDNIYGYRMNIAHPMIQELYRRYKRWKKIPVWCPLSDEERREFENYVLPEVEKISQKTAAKKTNST